MPRCMAWGFAAVIGLPSTSTSEIETVTALFGASAGGGVFVPVNPLLRPKQVGYIMRNCDVRVLVTSPQRLALLREELEQCKSVEHVVLVGHATASAADRPGRASTR